MVLFLATPCLGQEATAPGGSTNGTARSLQAGVKEGEGGRQDSQRPPYDPTGKRDPFKPFIKLVEEKTIERPAYEKQFIAPIKRYPLKEFRLAGILWVGNQPRAMVVDPEQNTYYLGVGDEIGNMNGKIIEIRENGILVEERSYAEDIFGVVQEKKTKSVLAFVEK
jgi:Tfp pilus assembly protein PilP